MGKSIDQETRYKAVVHYTHFSGSLRHVSKLYGVSKSSLQRWIITQRGGSVRMNMRRPVRQVSNQVRQCVQQHLTTNPFTTLDQLASHLQRECSVRMSRSSAGRLLHKLRWSKKNVLPIVDVQHAPANVLGFCQQYRSCDANDIICIDEAGFYIGDHGRRGWSPVGQRAMIKRGRTLRREKLTLLMAVSRQGVVAFQVLPHNCKKADFVQFIHSLPLTPGKVLLMDNIAFHHSHETLDAIKQKQASCLFTLPYSPRLNAIENVFAVLKSRFRTLCPVHATSASFDYKSCMESILRDWQSRSFDDVFSRVDKVVDEAWRLGGEGFCGYG
jgi:transposase